jgi:hypothetical protein
VIDQRLERIEVALDLKRLERIEVALDLKSVVVEEVVALA